MAATHLAGGRDVVLPQYFSHIDEVVAFEELAHEHGATFREVVLLDDRDAAIERFYQRSNNSDDPWTRHHLRLIELDGGPVVLGTMYNKLLEILNRYPGAVVVPSVAAAVEETYRTLVDSLREPAS